MSDEKIEAAGATKSGYTSERVHPRWRHWHFKSRIVLMILGAIAMIVYLVRSGLGKEYEGLGAALCVVACGGFLVWHVIHLFAEQDQLQEQQLRANHPTASSSKSNYSGQEANPTKPPETE